MDLKRSSICMEFGTELWCFTPMRMTSAGSRNLNGFLRWTDPRLSNMYSRQRRSSMPVFPMLGQRYHGFPGGRFYEIRGDVEEQPVYARGRPRADGTRKVKRVIYRLKLTIEPRETRPSLGLEKKPVASYSSPTSLRRPWGGMSSKELLRAYQDQHSVEQNFGFLKDPVFVNALFLKTPRRIEALGLVLVLALMAWRLMERTMRISLKHEESKVDGWNKRKTSRPTSFMMTTKFPAVIVIRTHKERFLAEPLDPIQEQYLRILGLSAAVFTDPYAACMLESGYAAQPWEDSG